MNIQSAQWSNEAQTTARVSTDNGEMFATNKENQ